MRTPYLRGEELPQSKLNAELVRRIRDDHQRKEEAIRLLNAQCSAAALAKKYGVGKTTIEKVLNEVLRKLEIRSAADLVRRAA